MPGSRVPIRFRFGPLSTRKWRADTGSRSLSNGRTAVCDGTNVRANTIRRIAAFGNEPAHEDIDRLQILIAAGQTRGGVADFDRGIRGLAVDNALIVRHAIGKLDIEKGLAATDFCPCVFGIAELIDVVAVDLRPANGRLDDLATRANRDDGARIRGNQVLWFEWNELDDDSVGIVGPADYITVIDIIGQQPSRAEPLSSESDGGIVFRQIVVLRLIGREELHQSR